MIKINTFQDSKHKSKWDVYTGLWKAAAMTQQTLRVNMDKVNKNSLDSHPIHLSFVRHLGTGLQHWIQDSTSPPWRHQNPPRGAGTTPRAAGASLLQNVRNSTLRPWGRATFPVPGTAQLPSLHHVLPPALPLTGLAPAASDELPEDSQDTAVVHLFLPKNRRGKILTQQSKSTSPHLTSNRV